MLVPVLIVGRKSGQFGFVSLEIEALAKVRNFEVRLEDPGFEKEVASIRDKIKTMVQIWARVRHSLRQERSFVIERQT